MEYLLSPKNTQVLESFSLVHTVFGFDFDGTLVPISETPGTVTLTPDSEQHLNKLSQHHPVAIITGRSIEDVKQYLAFTPKYIIGNHGIEGNHSVEELDGLQRTIETYKKLILDQYLKIFETMGILLEDKKYTLSLHYRNARNPAQAEQFLLTNLSNYAQASVTKGKMVINIIPEKGMTKGQAFLRLLQKEKAKFGFYIGDDLTDEDVFIHKNPRLLTVKVGYSPDSHASYYLKEQEEIVQVLEILCRGKN